jgi:hypothetical protein
MRRGERLSFGKDERSALSWRIIRGERLSFANHLLEGAESRQQYSSKRARLTMLIAA